jgi:hypothetical protein
MPSIEPFTPVIDTIRDALPTVQQSIQGAFANFQEDPALSVHIAKDAFEREREEKKEEKQGRVAQQGIPVVTVVKPKVPIDDLRPKPTSTTMYQYSVQQNPARPSLYYFA